VRTIEIPYGESHFSIRVPCERFDVLSGRKPDPGDNRLTEILHSREFRHYADKKTLCIVNDGTRPTRTRDVIDQGGLDCDYIVATGAHAAPTAEELAYIFGPEFRCKRIQIHDALKSPSSFLGDTARGTPVRFNKAVFRYQRILIIGSVEPHWFAGFSGGRKGLLPGVSAFETIEKNHYLSLSSEATSLKLHGNPVHEDMMEAVRLLDTPILSLNLVIGNDNDTVGAFCGTLEDSLSEAAKLASLCYSADVAQHADIVVACAPFPMDADLYQAQKALVNASRACKVGGLIVLVAQCRNGIGPRAFYDLMTTHGTPEHILAYTKENYKLGYPKAASIAKILLRHQVSVISELPSDQLLAIGLHTMTPVELETSITSVSDDGGTILYIPAASVTVPRTSTPTT